MNDKNKNKIIKIKHKKLIYLLNHLQNKKFRENKERDQLTLMYPYILNDF